MRNAREIVVKYKELIDELPEMIHSTGVKDKYVYEKLEISKATFYRKVREKLWTAEEIERILDIIKWG